MSDLFSSAWSYLSGGGGGGGEGEGGSRFVGQEVDMGGGKVVKIKKIIAEGLWSMYMLPCCLFDLACFFLPSLFISLTRIIYIYIIMSCYMYCTCVYSYMYDKYE